MRRQSAETRRNSDFQGHLRIAHGGVAVARGVGGVARHAAQPGVGEAHVEVDVVGQYVQANPGAGQELAALYERGLRARDSLRAFLAAFIPAIAQVAR